jgi:DNA integrity scanning protein DisA with diadenylate cyclase activity
VIISQGKIKFAGSILPLTKMENLDKKFGTRHRAAIGITEETDAISIVVSEERGTISIAYRGKISSELDAEMLKTTLIDILSVNKVNSKGNTDGK